MSEEVDRSTQHTLSPQSTAEAIRNRKTTKLLSDVPLPEHDIRGTVDRLIEIAGWAPFHRACDSSHREADSCGVQPWRMYALDSSNCRRLAKQLPAENAGKIPRMLASADAMIQTTWLPNPATRPLDGVLFDATLANMEHIAAASAAIQNLLLAATAEGIPSYWSSGGVVLRETAGFERLKIPQEEILLGSIFLFPEDLEALPSTTEVVGSKLRHQRSPQPTWARWVEV